MEGDIFFGVFMDYDIYYNGSVCGKLRVEREGLLTVFSADCEMHDGVLRLYVCGKCAKSLGVMQPDDGRLRLEKRLTANEVKALPEFRRIELAASPPVPRESSITPPMLKTQWRECFDGTLMNDEYIALPCSLRCIPCGVRCERINGKEYLLFKY